MDRSNEKINHRIRSKSFDQRSVIRTNPLSFKSYQNIKFILILLTKTNSFDKIGFVSRYKIGDIISGCYLSLLEYVGEMVGEVMAMILLRDIDLSWSFGACVLLMQRFACPGTWRFGSLVPVYLLRGRDKIARNDYALRMP